LTKIRLEDGMINEVPLP